MFKPQIGMRKAHRWGVVVIALPFLVVVVTGIFLQLKREINWVQPPTQMGSAANQTPPLSFAAILAAARRVPEASIQTWKDIDRLDVRPGDGMLKVRSQTNWEIQLDWQTGEVLQVAYRRNEWLESLHDGSWFHEDARLWVFLPTALVVFMLWGTGLYLFVLPLTRRRKNRRPTRHLPKPTKTKPLPRDEKGNLELPPGLRRNGQAEEREEADREGKLRGFKSASG